MIVRNQQKIYNVPNVSSLNNVHNSVNYKKDIRGLQNKTYWGTWVNVLPWATG